jgi:allophanate hydrolase subunit 2
MSKAAQTPAGGTVRFEFVTLEQAVEIDAAFRADLARLPSRIEPLVRDPHDIPDLLSYQLIGGVISATD